MLDWEAPTGGYLLTACLASGHAAGRGVRHWLEKLSDGAGYCSSAGIRGFSNEHVLAKNPAVH
jgi:hypothetical protein